MKDNLALWKSVEMTDPKHTKPITGKPYKGNSPKPHYLVMKATETFGPCGIGWGFEIVSQQFVPGSPGDIVHVAHIRVWYEYDGKRATVEHVGQTMFAGKNKNGLYTDEDAPKKSVTDGLIKALSMIGFAGDIFLGRFDDSKYVEETSREFREAEREATPLTSDEIYVRDSQAKIAAFNTLDEINAWWVKENDNRKRLLSAEQAGVLFKACEIRANVIEPQKRSAA